MPKLDMNLKPTNNKEVEKLYKTLKESANPQCGKDAAWRKSFRAGMAMCIA